MEEQEHYFPQFAATNTTSLKEEHKDILHHIENAEAVVAYLKGQAEDRQWELNYRKHVEILKPLMQKNDELLKIINDPSTHKLNLRNAQRAQDKAEKAIMLFIKHGDNVDAGSAKRYL